MTRRLRVIWEPAALDDLERSATARQAQRVLDVMERMSRIGWSLGRATPMFGAQFRYFPAPPLGVVYDLWGAELRVVRVVDVRRLRRSP